MPTAPVHAVHANPIVVDMWCNITHALSLPRAHSIQRTSEQNMPTGTRPELIEHLQDLEQHNFVRRRIRGFKSALRDSFCSLVHRLCNALPCHACGAWPTSCMVCQRSQAAGSAAS